MSHLKVVVPTDLCQVGIPTSSVFVFVFVLVGEGVFFLFVLRKAGNLDFYVKFSDFFPKFGKCESRSQIFW